MISIVKTGFGLECVDKKDTAIIRILKKLYSFFFGDSLEFEFYVPTFRNTLPLSSSFAL
jgi:hypothetical protein